MCEPTLYCLLEIYFTYKDSDWLKVKEYRKICHTNMNQKKKELK